jgi:uncharacterized protein YjiK
MKYLVFALFTALVTGSCSLDNAAVPEPALQLILLDSYSLNIPEPSDLTYDHTSNSLWTVSDADNFVYNIDFTGEIIQILPFQGDDLEGIAYSATDSTLWLAEESLSQIVNINLQGLEIARHQIPVTTGTNSGLEGICFNQDGTISLVKEKDPGKYIRLDAEMTPILDIMLDFANDYSAISYDYENEFFWIVSDQNQSLYAWTPETGVISKYDLPFPKPEGVCYVPSLECFFLVSDSQNMLYKMKLMR